MESDFSDTIKGPVGTLDEPIGKSVRNKSPKAVTVQEHKTATIDLAGGMVPWQEVRSQEPLWSFDRFC